jgi:hypothetical protein
MGCEEPIELDIAADAPRLAIDARLWTRPAPWEPHGQVTLTRSGHPFLPESIEWIPDAVITLWDDAGQRDTLVFVAYSTLDSLLPGGLPPQFAIRLRELPPAAGLYVTRTLQAIPGRTYTLHVQLPDGTQHQAQSLLPLPVPIDSATYRWLPRRGPIEEGYFIEYHFQDPPEPGQNYMSFHYLNDTLQNSADYITVGDDFYINGSYVHGPLFRPFRAGDTVVVEHQTVTRAVLDHWAGLLQLMSGTGGPFSGPGANPPTNFSGGALGLFWCSAPQRDTVVIRP